MEQEEEAGDVDEEQVQAQVQADAVLVQQGGADVEQGPAVGGQDLVGEFAADLLKGRRLLVGALAAQVGGRDAAGRDVVQDALAAVGVDDRAEHVVPVDDLLEGRGQPVDVQVRAVELQVVVAGDAAQFEALVTADQIGALDVGERERLVAQFGLRGQRRQIARVRAALEESDQLVVVLGDGRGQLRCEGAIGRLDIEALAVEAKIDTTIPQLGKKIFHQASVPLFSAWRGVPLRSSPRTSWTPHPAGWALVGAVGRRWRGRTMARWPADGGVRPPGRAPRAGGGPGHQGCGARSLRIPPPMPVRIPPRVPVWWAGGGAGAVVAARGVGGVGAAGARPSRGR